MKHANLNLSKILSITQIEVEEQETFDLTIEDTHCFFVQSVGPVATLVHNCRHILNEYAIGPVAYKMEAQVMRPRAEMIETGVATTHDYKLWAYAMRFLARHEIRNELIVKHVQRDVAMGRSIVVPVYTVEHAKLLTKMINEALPDEKPARLFYSGISKEKRKQYIQEAINGDAKVIVGIRSMLQLGINVPRWDSLYVVMPISNPPNFKQETSRVRTPMEGKPQPVVKFFLDNFPPSKGCFRTCYWQTVIPERFAISQENRNIADKYLRKFPKKGEYSAASRRKVPGKF